MKKTYIILFALFVSCVANAQWSPLVSGTNRDLTSIDFVNTMIGYASGGDGTILKISDGGTTWITQHSGTFDYLKSICFVDINHGFSVGYSGSYYKTTDGGATWNRSVKVAVLPHVVQGKF